MNPGSSRGPSRLSCFGRNFRSGRHRLKTIFLRGKQRDVEPKQEVTMPFLTDDLVVEILPRLPLKSFCRFKCVCKCWLAFSSDSHHRQKLPRTPTGLLYQRCDYGSAIHLAGLPSSDREIDTTLSFVPSYENLRLMDCSNGLLLFCYEGFSSYFPDISRSIVCNPATQEWMFLPPTQPADDSNHHLVLCFDPLWSQHFYVFRFWKRRSSHPGVHPINETEIFSSQDFTWHSSLLESETGFHGQSHFIHGVLYVEHSLDHCVLAMEIDATATCTQLLKRRTIQLPGFPVRPEMFRCCGGCAAQSSGVLCYAQQEIDGCMMQIWSMHLGGMSWSTLILPDPCGPIITSWLLTLIERLLLSWGSEALGSSSHLASVPENSQSFRLPQPVNCLQNFTTCHTTASFPASVGQGIQDEC